MITVPAYRAESWRCRRPPLLHAPRLACSGRNCAEGLDASHLVSAMKRMHRQAGYATPIPWVASGKISVMSS